LEKVNAILKKVNAILKKVAAVFEKRRHQFPVAFPVALQ